MAKTKTMSENARKVLGYLQAAGAGVKFTYKEVADALNFEHVAAVVGTITSLAKNGYAEKFEETVEVDGKEKAVKYFALTEAGVKYDPDATTEE